MYAWVSCAISGVAVRPVPMAQTGSYAMTTSFIISEVIPYRAKQNGKVKGALCA